MGCCGAEDGGLLGAGRARDRQARVLVAHHQRYFFIDDALLSANGVTDFDRSAVVAGARDLIPDFLVD